MGAASQVEWRLLEDVPAEQVRKLMQIARRRKFVRNEIVFHRDDPSDSLHLISKGFRDPGDDTGWRDGGVPTFGSLRRLINCSSRVSDSIRPGDRRPPVGPS